MAEISNHLINVIFQSTGAEPTAAKIKQIKEALGGVGKEAPPTTQKMGDLERAFRRAAIVAPIWMVARAAIKETLAFIRDGVQHILEMEDAMHGVTATMQEMGESGAANIAALKEEFIGLAIATGVTEVKIANNFAATNRILQDRVKTMIAVKEATKLSLETGVDSVKIAESMAFLYKLQGDSLVGLTTDTAKFQEISALLYETQAKTPGGLDKLIGDIKSFQAAMNLTDFGIENTIKLFGALEAAGVSNSMALRTGLLNVLRNIDQASTMLGISFTKDATSADKFTKVLTAVGVALRAPGDKSNILNVMKDLFGSVIRGGTNLGSLAKDMSAFQEAFSGTGTTARNAFLQQKQLEDVTNGADNQIKVFQVLRKEAGDAFITGIIGGKDFSSSIKQINSEVEISKVRLEALGIIIRTVFTQQQGKFFIGPFGAINRMALEFDKIAESEEKTNDALSRVNVARKGGLSVAEMVILKGEISNNQLKMDEALRTKILADLDKMIAKESAVSKEKSKQVIDTEKIASLTKLQMTEIEDLLLQYEKAKPEEKPALRRKIELTQMTEQNQMFAFSTSKEDRALLLEMASKLTDDVKAAIAGVVSYEQGIYTQGRFTPSLKTPEGTPSTTPTTNNITNSLNVNIDLLKFGRTDAEEVAGIINDELQKAFLAKEEWKKKLANELIKLLPSGK